MERAEFLQKSLSNTYTIHWNSAFPIHTNDKRVTIDPSGLRRTCHQKILPSPEEERLLQKYGLKRFPKSVEDLAAAASSIPGEILKDEKTLLKLFDGEVYANMNPKEQMYCAIEDDDGEEITRIMQTNSLQIREPLAYETTAITYASHTGKAKAIDALIHLGANPNQVDSHGDSCLHSAACAKNLASIRTLLAGGATTVLSRNRDGRIPLHQLFCFDLGETTIEEMKEMIRLLMPTHSPSDLHILIDNQGMNCFQIAEVNRHCTGLAALKLFESET